MAPHGGRTKLSKKLSPIFRLFVLRARILRAWPFREVLGLSAAAVIWPSYRISLKQLYSRVPQEFVSIFSAAETSEDTTKVLKAATFPICAIRSAR